MQLLFYGLMQMLHALTCISVSLSHGPVGSSRSESSSLNYERKAAAAADPQVDWLPVRYCQLCAAIDTHRM